MKNLKIKFGLFSLLAVLAASVFLTSCEQEIIEQPLITDYEKAEQILESYIVEEEGVFMMTETDPHKLGIEPQVFAELYESFNEMNQLIQKGEIKPEWINKTLDLETMEEISTDLRGCNDTKISFGWYSFTIYYSTDVASMAAEIGGTFGNKAAQIMERVIDFVNQYWCTCGYKYKASYLNPSAGYTSCQ